MYKCNAMTLSIVRLMCETVDSYFVLNCTLLHEWIIHYILGKYTNAGITSWLAFLEFSGSAPANTPDKPESQQYF